MSNSREYIEEQLEELRTRKDDLSLQMDDVQSDIDEYEAELEVWNEHDDMQDIIDDDNRQRAEDVAEALSGGTW